MDSGVKKLKKDNTKISVNDIDEITSLKNYDSISSVYISKRQKESQIESKVSRIFNL